MKRRLFQGLLIVALLCGAVLLAHPTAAWALDGTGSKEAPYQISSAADLQAFAEKVNSGQKTACAVLTTDITINSNVLDKDGNLNGIPQNEWTPIGNGSKSYTGTFDGKGYTISGLYINSNAIEYVGLFGCIGEGGSVQNLTLADSYIYSFASDANVGSICGYNDRGTITDCSNCGTVTGANVGGICGYNNWGTISSCSTSGTVTGAVVGGICGYNSGSITNCSNSGDVSSNGGVSNEGYGYVGGICGGNSFRSITKNCSNSGTVSGSDNDNDDIYVGGICGENRNSITNCYWLNDTPGEGSGDATEKTAEEYASGEVAWLLNQGQENGPWRQNLGEGKDAYPTLDPTHDTVVQLTFDANIGNEEDDFYQYANSGDTVTVPGDPTRTGYTFGGWNTAADGSGTSFPSTTPAVDTTFYAQWTAKVYTVTLNTNNGTINNGDVTSYTYGTATTLPTDVTRAGYTFGGWYVDADFSGDAVTAIAATDTGNKTYWAKWTAKSYPSTPPTVSEETIDAIADAQPGETVTVDLSSGSTTLDKDVFETLAGKDVTLVVELGDGLSWTVNGTDIPENADFTDIDLGVTMNSDGIPVDIINAITGERESIQLELAHNGAFGFTMTLTAPLGEENAGYWANLYYFNEEAGKMTFETAAEIGDDGSVSLLFSHASQYAIVIDDHNHGVVTLPFTDVSEGDWFYDPVCFVYSQGLMTGTSATTFEPNTPLTRAMLVAMLHRLEGSPAASGGDFSDVADGDWYAQAVNWAASVGVVNGFDDGTFQPNTAITREQMAAILRNFDAKLAQTGAAYKGLDVSASGDLSIYIDAASVSDWAKESVEWMVGSGLLGGYDDNTLRPQGTTTRAEVAAVLERYLEK